MEVKHILKTNKFYIRPIESHEIGKGAAILACTFYNDIFFKWCVENPNERKEIVTNYYKVYLQSVGCVAHVAIEPDIGIVGASVWLPKETQEGMYDKIKEAVGVWAPRFDEVADRSHKNEPEQGPFYQLVGFGVLEKFQGMGIGYSLLKYHLDILDKKGIPTYLEASSPYSGSGIYGKFGYVPFGEPMVFTQTAVLYPLYRDRQKGT